MNLLMLKILDDVCVYISFIIIITKNESFSSFFFLLVKKNLLNPRIEFFFHHFSLDTNLEIFSFFWFNLSPLYIYKMNESENEKKGKFLKFFEEKKDSGVIISIDHFFFISIFFWPRWKCFFPFQRFFSFYFRWWWWWWL